MQQFTGTKLVNAKPMNRTDYNILRGWKLPADEDGTDKGFLVEYADGGKANVEGFAGYVSWSPAEVFEKSYNKSGNMSFGDAVLMAKRGHKVSRIGWNGAGMYAVVMPGFPNGVPANEVTANLHGIEVGEMVRLREYWALKTAQHDIAMWSPSGSDSLANDWCVIT
jgi:hypothetical protein|tara:strand:- start:175 stop:672 length:498 start_codon:yes stop_codon:yes gene_type:complete